MEYTKNFKYLLPDLPEGCPELCIKNLNEGTYGRKYFRVCKESPPSEEDFTPKFFLKRCRSEVEMRKIKNDHFGLCQMAGASILKTEDDAIKLIRKFKKMGKYIFCGIITKNDGLLLDSPSQDYPSHCSFFVYESVDENKIFKEGIYHD